MSKCDIWVELASGDRFRPGDEIAGRVHVAVDADCRCDGLDVSLKWYTHGLGNVDSKAVVKERLGSANWMAGEKRSYPFSLIAPEGPFCYRGEFLNVDWAVEARADIPWALDPKGETEFLLEAPEGAGLSISETEGMTFDAMPIAAKIFGIGFILLFVGSFVGSGLFVLVSGLSSGDLLEIIGGVIFLIPSVFFFRGPVGKFIAERRIGKVKIDVVDQGPEANYLECVVLFPGAKAKLNGVTATLVIRERCIEGSGSDQTTHVNELFSGGERLQHYGAGPEGLRFQGRLPRPKDIAYSFDAPNNKIIWTTNVHIDIAAWPDWKHDIQLTAEPS